jgi:hypothetical protein
MEKRVSPGEMSTSSSKEHFLTFKKTKKKHSLVNLSHKNVFVSLCPSVCVYLPHCVSFYKHFAVFFQYQFSNLICFVYFHSNKYRTTHFPSLFILVLFSSFNYEFDLINVFLVILLYCFIQQKINVTKIVTSVQKMKAFFCITTASVK